MQSVEGQGGSYMETVVVNEKIKDKLNSMTEATDLSTL